MKQTRMYLILFIGFGFYLFSNGRWIIAIAPWIAFPCFLYFFRKSDKVVLKFIIFVLLITIINIIAWFGIIRIPGIGYYLFCLFFAINFGIIFLLDRFIFRKKNNFIAILFFPLFFTGFEYLTTLFSPFYSWGSFAYSQYGNQNLVQIASITGIGGIVFIITWVSSMLVFVIMNYDSTKKILIPGLITILIILLVFIYGGFRLLFMDKVNKTISVGGIIHSKKINNSIKNGDKEFYMDRISKIAKLGIKIVTLQEASLIRKSSDNDSLIEDFKKIAKKEKVHIILPVVYLKDNDLSLNVFNGYFWFDENGQLIAKYKKTFPMPGERCSRGDGKFPTINIGNSNVSAIICFDINNLSYTRKISRRSDVIILPSNDWKELNPLHTRMTSFRAVENGVSILRVTGNGLSAAYDPSGRLLASTDYYKNSNGYIFTDLPTTKMWTLYSYLGDYFNILTLICAYLILVLILFDNFKERFIMKNKKVL